MTCAWRAEALAGAVVAFTGVGVRVRFRVLFVVDHIEHTHKHTHTHRLQIWQIQSPGVDAQPRESVGQLLKPLSRSGNEYAHTHTHTHICSVPQTIILLHI